MTVNIFLGKLLNIFFKSLLRKKKKKKQTFFFGRIMVIFTYTHTGLPSFWMAQWIKNLPGM